MEQQWLPCLYGSYIYRLIRELRNYIFYDLIMGLEWNIQPTLSLLLLEMVSLMPPHDHIRQQIPYVTVSAKVFFRDHTKNLVIFQKLLICVQAEIPIKQRNMNYESQKIVWLTCNTIGWLRWYGARIVTDAFAINVVARNWQSVCLIELH